MRKLTAVCAGLVVLFAAGSTLAAPRVVQDACAVAGKPFIDVHLTIEHDADSGTAGNYWAFDTLERHLRVWAGASAGVYCVAVEDRGLFQAIAGQTSPGNTTVLTGRERGTIKGRYIGTVTGTLSASPQWPTRGTTGKIDYQCDVNGNCPGYVSWFDQYFDPGYIFTFADWGWRYNGGKYGVWVNAQSGNSGDIIPR